MGLEKFALEQTERIIEHEQISRQLWSALHEICKKFDEYTYKSPWKDRIQKVLKNGNKLSIGKAGGKVIETPNDQVLVYRKCKGYGESLPDGTPTLRFEVRRPSGVTEFRVRPNLNGTFSPVRL